jgi:nicotinamidase-related amidase
MPALLIVDMQRIMQQRIDAGRDCVNPDAPGRVRTLAGAFRACGWPVLHVRHRDEDAASPLHPAGTGFPPMPEADARDGEAIFFKQTSSAFASTDLAAHLNTIGCFELVVTGAVAGFCVNSTVRAGADLGLAMTVVRDALIGFDLPAAGLSARTIFDVTIAHLEADFATIVDTAELMDRSALECRCCTPT